MNIRTGQLCALQYGKDLRSPVFRGNIVWDEVVARRPVDRIPFFHQCGDFFFRVRKRSVISRQDLLKRAIQENDAAVLFQGIDVFFPYLCGSLEAR